MEEYYVYLLESQIDSSWYIGYTKELQDRINEHNSGKSYYTKRKLPWKIIYFEVSFHKMDAIAREKYLKSGMGRRYLKNRLKNQLNF
jgi:putative endonuclease